MKPTQKELNEFVLDLVELIGKHFTGYFDKTKVAGGNEGVSVRILRAGSESELEITTDRLDPHFIFGSVQWNYRPFRDDKGELFTRILADLNGVLSDRISILSIYKRKDLLARFMTREPWDDAALRQCREKHPEGTQIEMKRWSGLLETIYAVVP